MELDLLRSYNRKNVRNPSTVGETSRSTVLWVKNQVVAIAY